ncbi:LuxR C-terminal-related transcriptional regulator [Haloferula sargassicola]|uniref:HTH luxR-type domain-containing protein n=1 Tax=Haloferula sargassicola TaxID=490096 RepID=A0ABP9UPI6_9BACT
MEVATTFDELCSLVTGDLPPLVNAAAGTVFQMLDHRKVEMVRGDFSKDKTADNLQRLNALLEQHPLSDVLLAPLGGQLGITVSRRLPSGEYSKSKFAREMYPEPVTDSMIGELFSWCRRSAVLTVRRTEGTFTDEEIERFDVVIFAARTLCDRIAGRNVEREVHNFFMTQSGAGPVMAFLMKSDGGVMPVNYEALRFVETNWAADEAFRQLDDSEVRRIMSRVESSWQDPLRARFQAVELDLGAGKSTFYVLPNSLKQFYIFTIGPSREQGGEDRSRLVLTGRQCEIMEWIAEGKTSWEVATILGISPRTVEKHMEAIFQRLNVENRVAAARRFLDLKAGVTF